MTSETQFYTVEAQNKLKMVIRLLRIYLLVLVIVVVKRNGFVLLGKIDKNSKSIQTLYYYYYGKLADLWF